MPKALIVEDEPEANELLSMLVQLRGYQTASAFTGTEALAKVEQERPDLVFLDLMLPDMNGYDVCRNLKSCRLTSSIPVVMVTARYAAENRLQGFRLGATDYVPKPYTPDQIFSAMAEAKDWTCRLAGGEREGVISIDARSDVSHLVEISQLRCLLLNATPISEEAARTLDLVLVDLAILAVESDQESSQGLIATIDYRWSYAGIEITLKDESGWFSSENLRSDNRITAAISRGNFHEVIRNETLHQIIMTLFFESEA